jgi:alkylhydroperoxidase/carboxymuconolactone decarboxylase family protein YurZ
MINPSFATGLDWSDADRITDDERRSLATWYAETHEVDSSSELSLTGFVDFWLSERPDVLKSYRRAIETTCGFDALPAAAVGLLFLHQYVVTANAKGVLYEVIASRYWGASRDQVVETLAFAFLHAGPHGMAVATASCGDYLGKWTEETAGSATWPAGWRPDPVAMRSGIDYYSDGFSHEDRAALEEWHRRTEGEVPDYVAYLAERNPAGLKAFRHRFEHALRGALPKQMAPLFLLQVAGLRGEPAAQRRAAHMARAFGVSDEQIAHTVSMLQIYTGHTSMDAAIRGLSPDA